MSGIWVLVMLFFVWLRWNVAEQVDSCVSAAAECSFVSFSSRYGSSDILWESWGEVNLKSY